MKYVKYHGLGNDYLVIGPADLERAIEGKLIGRICDRNYGVGSDGILFGPLASRTCDFRLRIFNPDGSEAEKSGNGLRIFSRYLWDQGLVGRTLSLSRPSPVERCATFTGVQGASPSIWGR